jgi:hypothetical protein
MYDTVDRRDDENAWHPFRGLQVLAEARQAQDAPLVATPAFPPSHATANILEVEVHIEARRPIARQPPTYDGRLPVRL